MTSTPRITLLSGGVGGTKLAEGLAASRYADGLSIIANTGDDTVFHGLHVSPDVDTLLYTLSGQVNREQGWGLADDTYRTLEKLAALGATDTWMLLGDLDLATHIRRTDMLHNGVRLTEATRALAENLGVTIPIHIPTDTLVQTQIGTDDGWLKFQEYFVRERCAPTVRDIAFVGAQTAQPTPEALQALANADVIVIAPSNPLVSIGPMLAVPGFEQALRSSTAPTVAISPLIGGQTVKGPADRMLEAQGLQPSPLGLAEYYGDLVGSFVIDRIDDGFTGQLRDRGFAVIEDDILMHSLEDKVRLAEAVVENTLQPAGTASCP